MRLLTPFRDYIRLFIYWRKCASTIAIHLVWPPETQSWQSTFWERHTIYLTIFLSLDSGMADIVGALSENVLAYPLSTILQPKHINNKQPEEILPVY